MYHMCECLQILKEANSSPGSRVTGSYGLPDMGKRDGGREISLWQVVGGCWGNQVVVS